MKNQIKRFCVMAIMVLLIYCICSPFSYALVAANWRECASAPGCSCTFQSTNATLKTYIIDSTGFFLNSHSAFQAFLNCVELAETNGLANNELKVLLYRAIENMEKAKAAYSNLKTTSENIPLNQEMIDQLMNFNYDEFQAKYGLIEPIFDKVKAILWRANQAYTEAQLFGQYMSEVFKEYYR